MKSRDHRMKASDRFNATEFPFARKVPFSEAFPEIASIRVELSQTGEGTYDWDRNRVFTTETFPGEYVDCTNRICYNGGISLGRILRDMVAKKESHREGAELCQGNEASPKGHSIYRKCLNRFEYKIDIEYKAQSTS
jgi:hypothetical protein